MFYSQSTKGFYDKTIHGDNIPKDSIEISADEHASIMRGQSDGKMITANGNGYPVLVEPVEPTNEELKARCKAQAKKLLVDSDWSQQTDVAGVLTNKAEFDAYRATVRDLFLRPVPEPVFPEEPEAIWGAQ